MHFALNLFNHSRKLLSITDAGNGTTSLIRYEWRMNNTKDVIK